MLATAITTHRTLLHSALITGSLLLASLSSAYASSPAPTRSLADVKITDRATGQVLPIYQHQGELWVAGRPGSNYGIDITNRTGRRILAIISVDGVNVLNGQTASATPDDGYVFKPWQNWSITGWRKSDSQVAAFYFSESDASYASRTGRPRDVGVIGVALFRERIPEPVRPPSVSRRSKPIDEYASAGNSLDEKSTADASSSEPLVQPLPAPTLPSAPASAPQASTTPQVNADFAAESRASPSAANKAAKRAPETTAQAQPRTPSLGTGHGALETSHTRTTNFDSASQRPEQVVRIRYDSYANLVAMGVIRSQQPARSPSAFPADVPRSYVPDPPRY